MEFKIEDFKHITPVQIRFNDVDALGHVNNAVAQEYFDLGRSGYLRDSLGTLLGKDGQHLVIVSFKTDFHRQIMPDDAIEVLTCVYKLGNKSLRMIQWIVKMGDAFPLVSSDSVMAGFYIPDESGMVLPDEWRNRFNQMEDGRLTPEINR
ncbi:acyl-CoA thioesterase [Alkaliflexus imshenetskii]|uniref:acyl-CoA thioesterase n=1 Tax=Alkaliflexus imshenetskii TaxID=286730 RepID=UPI0004AEBD9E|nr:acyl-CoA thioesterase [Alkaliflexus imshenetskii]